MLFGYEIHVKQYNLWQNDLLTRLFGRKINGLEN